MTRATKPALKEWITAWIRTELKVAEPSIDTEAPFTRFGMDSVHAMMMIGDLEEHLDRRLPPTLAWDQPTISALATFLADASPSPVANDDVLSRIDTMSEAELDAMLEQQRRGNR